MNWMHHVADRNEGNFTVCVQTPGDVPPTGPVTFTGPKTKKRHTIQPGAGWTHVVECPPGSIPGTLTAGPAWSRRVLPQLTKGRARRRGGRRETPPRDMARLGT
jgi:hypothetical protein